MAAISWISLSTYNFSYLQPSISVICSEISASLIMDFISRSAFAVLDLSFNPFKLFFIVADFIQDRVLLSSVGRTML